MIPTNATPALLMRGSKHLFGYFLDVCLDSLNPECPGEERHVLVRRSAYPMDVERFESTAPDLTLKPAKLDSIRDRRQEDVTVINFACEKQVWADEWPKTYIVGLLDRALKAWSGSIYSFGEFSDVSNDINKQRRQCGQKRIKTIPRKHQKLTCSNDDDDNNDNDDDGEGEESEDISMHG
jgi:hypothetical protein